MTNFNNLEKKLGYSFKNSTLLAQALTHRSKSAINYERLEFVGDGILDYVIALCLYTSYPYLAEGELSKIRSALVNQDTLAEIANEINLGSYLFLGDGEEKSDGRKRASILADSLEAIFAAISFDADFMATKNVIGKLFAEKLSTAEILVLKDSKTMLQEYLQGLKLPLPEYHILDITGPDHDSVFQVECVVKDLNLTVMAIGKSKKEASQNAARELLNKIERIKTSGK